MLPRRMRELPAGAEPPVVPSGQIVAQLQAALEFRMGVRAEIARGQSARAYATLRMVLRVKKKT